jgi:hypothetical protein
MLRMTTMAVTAALTLSTATAHAQSASTPSLGEVARQTAAKRANTKPTGRIYTNASLEAVPEEVLTVTPLAPVSASTVSVTGPSSSQAVAVKPAAASSNDPAGKGEVAPDENHWRNQAATLRADLARARATLDKQTNGTPQHEQAQRTVAFFQKRWDAFVEAAKTANVPSEWVEARQ